MPSFKIRVEEITNVPITAEAVTEAFATKTVFEQTLDGADFDLRRFVRELNKTPRRKRSSTAAKS